MWPLSNCLCMWTLKSINLQCLWLLYRGVKENDTRCPTCQRKSEQGTLELASCFLLCGACPRRRSNEASLSRYHCRQIQEMIQFYFCFLRYWSMCFSWSLQPVALCTLHTVCGSLPQVSWWCFIYSQIFFLVNYTNVTSFNSFAHILSGYLLTINQKALAWQALENDTCETAYDVALT